MREIVTVQVGQCGNRLGSKFWEVIAAEHGVNFEGQYEGNSPKQLSRIEVFFDEAQRSRYVPRAVLVDLDDSSLDSISSGPNGAMFNPDNFIAGQASAANNFAKGYHTDGNQLIDIIMDNIRQEAETADHLQGFKVIHALGGGSGSGLGSLILEKMKEEYPDRIICTYSVVPSPKTSDNVVCPYNALLSFPKLIEYSDQSYVLDNEALYGIAVKTLRLATPTYGDLNLFTSAAMAGTTCGLRFPGQLNCDLRKISVNLVPFPRLHFFGISFAPLAPPKSNKYKKTNVQLLTKQAFDPRNLMCACDPRKGRYLTSACMFRGKLSTHEVERHMYEFKQRQGQKGFVEWIPNNIMTPICDIPPEGMTMSSTFICNTTSIATVWRRIQEQYRAMFQKKAFLHWYTEEGMEEVEFTHSQITLNDLYAEYQQMDGGDEREEGEAKEDGDYDDEVFGSDDDVSTKANPKAMPGGKRKQSHPSAG